MIVVICGVHACTDVKYIVNHNGSAGCRFVVVGRRLDGKLTFPNGEYTLGTNDSLRRQIQPINHKGHSDFETLGINMISTFPLDPVHKLCLGVTKKLINLWANVPHKTLGNMKCLYLCI